MVHSLATVQFFVEISQFLNDESFLDRLYYLSFKIRNFAKGIPLGEICILTATINCLLEDINARAQKSYSKIFLLFLFLLRIFFSFKGLISWVLNYIQVKG